jgi:hypothetical protein
MIQLLSLCVCVCVCVCVWVCVRGVVGGGVVEWLATHLNCMYMPYTVKAHYYVLLILSYVHTCTGTGTCTCTCTWDQYIITLY